MDTFLLVDGRNLLWRAESAMSDLSFKGRPTGGIHGFLSILLRLQDEYQPTHTVICWDDWKAGPAERRKISKSYKHREPDPDREEAHRRVEEQQTDLLNLFMLLGVRQVRSSGWEADDVMGTLAREAHEDGARVRIFTGDRDLFQCVRGTDVTVVRTLKDGSFEEVTEKAVFDQYGVTVAQFVDFKALVGDPGDGYKGCPGIGEKTAAALLQKHGELDAVYLLGEPSREGLGIPDRFWKVLADNKQAVLECRKLATINTKAPLRYVKRHPDKRACMQFLTRLGMVKLLTQFDKIQKLAWR
jgi:DNA polymerase I